MSLMVQLAMSGARETMLAQSVNAHNLANAGTPGFRGDLIKFSDEIVNEYGRPSAANAVDFSEGELRITNRALDVAIRGDGWIAVETPEGTEGYTRRGDLRVDSAGILVNGAGRKILGNNGPVFLPQYSELAIGTDGSVSIVPPGQDADTLAEIDRIKLVTLDNQQLTKGADGLLRLPGNLVADVNAEVELLSGTIESSNVNPIEAMVRMIDLARKFESQIKMMQTSEENQQAMTNVMRIN